MEKSLPSSGSVRVRGCWWRWLSGAVTAVLIDRCGVVSLFVFAVLVGLLSVLFDIAPAEVSLPVMQLSRPAMRLGGPVVRIGGPVVRLSHFLLFPLHVSVGPFLELGGPPHLLRRGTVHRRHAVVRRIVVLTQLLRPCLAFFNSPGSLAGTVTGLTRKREASFASLVLVGSTRWSSHTGQHPAPRGTTPPPVRPKSWRS
jgi:hypothetical protein